MKKLSFMKKKKQCHVCEKGFFRSEKDKFKHIKVRDHCHCTGKFRGAADIVFNLRYNVPKKNSRNNS